MLKRVYDWIQSAGKAWAFRLIILAGTIALPLDSLGLVSISSEVALLFLLGAFYVFGEIFLSEIREVRRLKDESVELDWHSALPLIRADFSTADHVTLIARTGETFYYAVRDVILHRGHFTLRLVLTKRADEPNDFLEHQAGWIRRWQQLFDEVPGELALEVTECQLEIQGLIVDDRICYLGFRRERTGTKANLLNHIRCTSLSVQGRHLIDFVNTWTTIRKRDHVVLATGAAGAELAVNVGPKADGEKQNDRSE
ncbi:MAG: hypothetical protein GY835_03110 [bacterium]|nr:hypothetical protein [bacterium]